MKSGRARLRPVTMSSVGTATGNRMLVRCAPLNVLAIAAVPWLKWPAATLASTASRPTSAGSASFTRSTPRKTLSQRTAQLSQSYTNTPRWPVDPPEVIAV